MIGLNRIESIKFLLNKTNKNRETCIIIWIDSYRKHGDTNMTIFNLKSKKRLTETKSFLIKMSKFLAVNKTIRFFLK